MKRLDSTGARLLERVVYRAKCAWQGAQPLRFEKSIVRLAARHNLRLEVMPTLKTRSALEQLALHRPDLIILGGGWPELLPPEIFELAPLGAINTHPSLLPEFRGTDVHRWQILYGSAVGGTTIHYVDESFDTGAIIASRSFPIATLLTPQELFDQSAKLSAELMVGVIQLIQEAAPNRPISHDQPKDDTETLSKWPWGDRRLLQIDPRKTATQIERLIRASTQESYIYDGPWIEIEGVEFIIRRSRVANLEHKMATGTLFSHRRRLYLSCGEGTLEIRRIQVRMSVPLSRRSVTGRTFARRHVSKPKRIEVPTN